MSHFPIAIITPPGEVNLEALLAPYEEDTEDPRFLEFHDIEEEKRKDYENDSQTWVEMPDGRLLVPWDDAFRVKGSRGYGRDTHRVPMNYTQRTIPMKERYSTFDEYMIDWCGEERDDQGRYGYLQNPNAKWDWWTMGGRWSGSLKASKGLSNIKDNIVEEPHKNGGYDSALLGDIDFSDDEKAATLADKRWRVWVDGKKIDGIQPSGWKPEYYLDKYGNKENFIKCESAVWWRAVIPPDGRWFEVGEMLWWGLSQERADALVPWVLDFKKNFIDPWPPQYRQTVVDCHI